MYLKEIEIAGFKSFADKININLDNNITCVVGPNGSGKSNIVDAVRWVLGEQSVKSLRGEGNMSDVIFSGSKSRKPLNVASVSLTFDNSDNYLNMPYNTVSIKRRSYRSGESEYFINGEKCRLKDITELLLDTGVGKSSFNIISQGEISRILSSSPIERRFVVEEAAGILKYKTRREEALRKLDKTINNISRVNDIVGELEGRVEPLRLQSEKAKEYLEVKDKLKEVEVSLLVSEITDINNVYQENKRKIEKLNNEIISLNTEISNNKLEEVKVRSLEIEKEITELNNELVLKTKQEEEIEETKTKTLKELFDTQKILEKMKTGELTTSTEIDNAKKKMLEIIGRNYSVKDLVNKYLTTETEGLRDKLKALIHLKEMKKVSEQEFNSNVLAILQIISKNTKLNEEEQKLYNRISNNNLSSFQEDKGIDQNKLEKNLSKQK